MTYDIGDRVRLTARFTDAITGLLSDPTGITLRVRPPADTTTIYIYGSDPKIARDDVGVYHADIDVTASGSWGYKWTGTGAITAAEESSFYARTTRV